MAEILYNIITEAHEVKRLPPSFSSSHIVLIPKTDEPAKLQSVEAYRPISLTNVDYKVYMKVLAKRLQSVITSVVGHIRHVVLRGERY